MEGYLARTAAEEIFSNRRNTAEFSGQDFIIESREILANMQYYAVKATFMV